MTAKSIASVSFRTIPSSTSSLRLSTVIQETPERASFVYLDAKFCAALRWKPKDKVHLYYAVIFGNKKVTKKDI